MDGEGAEWNLVKDLFEAGLLTKAKRYTGQLIHPVAARPTGRLTDTTVAGTPQSKTACQHPVKE